MRIISTMRCRRCGWSGKMNGMSLHCSKCGGILCLPLIHYRGHNRRNGIWRYSRSLPLSDGCTLGEGMTPLLPAGADRLAAVPNRLFLKLETVNPTGSFKDRGSAVVCAIASALGVQKLAIASTGNAGASMAAYAAREGLSLTALVPQSIDAGKLWQLTAYGALIRRIEGDFSHAESEYTQLVSEGYFPAGSDNPFRTEGTKTISYELLEQMKERRIDRVIVPVGTGNLIVAMFKGFLEMAAAGILNRLPAIDAVQLRSIPSLLPVEGDKNAGTTLPSVAGGINIYKPLLAEEAREAVQVSGGRVYRLDDVEILAAQRDLACAEGVGAEATGAVSVAAYRKGVEEKLISPDDTVVAVVTGHILKQGIPVAENITEKTENH